MTITVATKKKLWALSGNKCAICKIPLIKEGQGNIGEECHIVAKKKDGARGKYPLEMNFLILYFYVQIIIQKLMPKIITIQ